MFKRTFLMLLFLLQLMTPSFAVANSAPAKKEEKQFISDELWAEAKEGIHYERPEEMPDINFPGFPNINLGFLKYLFYIFIFIILLWGISALVNLQTAKQKKVLPDISLKETNELTRDELLLLDLETKLQEALKRKDFYLATRLHYLQVLKQLVSGRYIEWKKDQTNKSIVYQLKDKRFQPLVKKIFSQYEMVWYGQKSIDEIAFSIYQQNCLEFNQVLTKGVKQ